MTKNFLYSYFVRNKYQILLLIFILLTILIPLNSSDRLAIWLLATVYLVVMLAVMHVLHHRSKMYYVLVVLAIGISSLQLIGILSNLNIRDNFMVHHGLMLVFYLSSIAVLLKDIAKNNVVTKDIIFGSLCVYYLIGLVFSGIFCHLYFHDPDSFDLSHTVNQSSMGVIFNLVYFSFSTLTTTGFGDIVAKSLLAKGMVIAEEVTGIFYLAVTVSRLVSGFNRGRSE